MSDQADDTTGVGVGNGLDADVITLSRAQYEALVPRPILHDPIAAAQQVIISAEIKVQRQRDHLLAAEQSLAEAHANYDALTGV